MLGFIGAGLVSRSADIRRSPCKDVAIVTQLVTRPRGRAGAGRPAVTQSPPRPARGGGHHEKKEQQDQSVRTFIGVADREEGNAAGVDADGDTLQMRAEVVSFGWRCWLAHAVRRCAVACCPGYVQGDGLQLQCV